MRMQETTSVERIAACGKKTLAEFLCHAGSAPRAGAAQSAGRRGAVAHAGGAAERPAARAGAGHAGRVCGLLPGAARAGETYCDPATFELLRMIGLICAQRAPCSFHAAFVLCPWAPMLARVLCQCSDGLTIYIYIKLAFA